MVRSRLVPEGFYPYRQRIVVALLLFFLLSSHTFFSTLSARFFDLEMRIDQTGSCQQCPGYSRS